MKKTFLGVSLISAAMVFISCDKGKLEPDYYSNEFTEGSMVTDKSILNIDAFTQDTMVLFSSNMWWDIEVTDKEGKIADWVDVTPKSGRGNVLFNIKSDSNYIMAAREAFVKISPDGQSDFEPLIFTIHQNAAAPFLNIEGMEIAGDSMFIGIVGSNTDIKVHANMTWEINNTNAPWFSFSSTAGGGANIVDRITGSYSSNSSGGIRIGEIIFQGTNFSRKLVVKQKDQFDRSQLSVENDALLIARWTPVIGAVTYDLVFTDENDAPVNTISNIENTVTEYDLSDYFSSIDYSGIIKVSLKANSTDPTIFSISNELLSHSHFANGSGDGSAGKEYLIANMRHLNNINASGELNKNYKQVVDFDFTGVATYSPVGLNAAQQFTGTYTGAKTDGGKFKVINSNFSVDNIAVSFFGMFGVIGSGAVISDLTFENCSLDLKQASTTPPGGFAHVVGVNLGGTVKNIEIVNCEINLNTLSAATFIGSVVGNNGEGVSTKGLVENCTTTGGRIFTLDISNSSKSYTVGGIAGIGVFGSEVKNCANISTPLTSRGTNTGGIAGKDCTVINSFNRANILGGTNTGGIIAFISTTAYIEKCYNTGNIVYRYGQAGYYYGGIVGKIVGTTGPVKISECFNSGNITAEITNRPSMFGGIAGQVTIAEIVNCYNTGNVTLACTDAAKPAFAGGIAGNIGENPGTFVANCYVTGIISDGGTASVAGERCAVAGKRASPVAVIRDTYYLPLCAVKALGGVDQTTNAIDVTVKSASDLGSVASYDVSWDFNDKWSAPAGTYPYPQLKAVPHIAGNE